MVFHALEEFRSLRLQLSDEKELPGRDGRRQGRGSHGEGSLRASMYKDCLPKKGIDQGTFAFFRFIELISRRITNFYSQQHNNML